MTIFDSSGYADSMPRDRLAVLQSAERIPGGAFASLSFEQRKAAEAWLWKFCQKWGEDLPSWRYAILVGVAKRLAVNPPIPNFGVRLHRHHGANALIERYRRQGIPNPHVAVMNAARAWKRAGCPSLPSAQIGA